MRKNTSVHKNQSCIGLLFYRNGTSVKWYRKCKKDGQHCLNVEGIMVMLQNGQA